MTHWLGHKLISLGTAMCVRGVTLITGKRGHDAWLALISMHVGTADAVGLRVNVEKLALALSVIDLGERR